MLFDIRTVVGALLGCYGLILVGAAIVHDTAADRIRSGGWNVNLWTGLGLLGAAALFWLWSFLRPLGAGGASDPPYMQVAAGPQRDHTIGTLSNNP